MTEPTNGTFDPRRYWEDRLQAHPDITGVGYLGRSPAFIEVQYRSRMRRIEKALRRLGLSDLTGRAVLDAGSGIGIWLDFWHRHHATTVAGLDFAEASVNRLRERFPGDVIVQADLTASALPLPPSARYDLISAFDVLLHIVTPEGFVQAIANLASRSAPGGWLVVSDAIVAGTRYAPPYPPADYQRVRTLADYREALEANGFEIVSLDPATVFLSTPLEGSSRITFESLRFWWRASGAWANFNLPSRVLGPPTIALDQMACNLMRGERAPGAKLLFARHAR
jgi:SAM-dependent methyltransferase